MKYIFRILLALILLPVIASCSDDDYKAQVTDVRLVRCAPSTVYSGDLVKVLGRNFSPNKKDNVVTINGQQAEVVEASKDELQILMPKNEPGRYEVTVNCPAGEATGAMVTYLKAPDHQYIVKTVLGTKGQIVTQDGIGTSAYIRMPQGVALSPTDGTMWLIDRQASERRILRVDRNMSTKTVFTDPAGTPWHGCCNSKGEYWFVNKDNGNIRKVNPATNEVTLVATGPKQLMYITFDKEDNAYIVARDERNIYKCTPDGKLSVYCSIKPVLDKNIACCMFAPNGNLYVGSNGYTILEITPDLQMNCVVGDGQSYPANSFTTDYDGQPGDAKNAKIGNTWGFWIAKDGTIWYPDSRFHVIRKITIGADGTYEHGTVETVAGTGKAGYADGIGMKATFNTPYDMIASEDQQTLYICQPNDNILRQITIK